MMIGALEEEIGTPAPLKWVGIAWSIWYTRSSGSGGRKQWRGMAAKARASGSDRTTPRTRSWSTRPSK